MILAYLKQSQCTYNPGVDDATAADMYMNFFGWGPFQSMFNAL